MHRPRPLLPKTERSRRSPPVEKPSKRRKVSLACDNCRQRKSKCDGVRPTCDTCAKNQTGCHYSESETHQIRQRYDQLRQRGTVYEDLVELLRNLTERDAAEVVRHLRAGVDAATILSQVQDGNLLMQLSLAPETRRLYEFPYIPRMPSHLFTGDNPYLDSLLYEAALSCEVSRSVASNADTGVQGISGKQRAAHTDNYHNAYLMPYHAAHMMEPIIEKIKARPWTQVISDDRQLRHLICAYFYYPHPCGPFVHKDLFLEDMAAGQTQFCSPLLVNAMLAIAVQSCRNVPNRSKVWLPDSLTYKFLAEARRLWDLEPSGEGRIPTIQAALILSYTTTNNSLDKLGTMFLEQAIEMSKVINLFGRDNTGKDTKMGQARIFTAWAVFSWQNLFDYYFFRSPHLIQAPEIPLPDPRTQPKWYGEIWAQYPHCQMLGLLHVGHKLRSEATLHSIMNHMGSLLFGGSSPRSLTIEEIAVLKSKLDEWWDTLPEPLHPKKVIYPHHLTLHVQYYQVVIALMKLLLTFDPKDSSAVSNICAGKTPDLVLHETNVKLETIMRLYYTRHSFDHYDPWIAFALAIVGDTAIANLARATNSEPHLQDNYRSTIILTAQGLNNQGLNYHLGTLLSIQFQSALEPTTLQLVRTYVPTARVNSNDQGLIVKHSHSQWPVPIIGVNEDPEKVRLKDLLKKFEEVEV